MLRRPHRAQRVARLARGIRGPHAPSRVRPRSRREHVGVGRGAPDAACATAASSTLGGGSSGDRCRRRSAALLAPRRTGVGGVANRARRAWSAGSSQPSSARRTRGPCGDEVMREARHGEPPRNTRFPLGLGSVIVPTHARDALPLSARARGIVTLVAARARRLRRRRRRAARCGGRSTRESTRADECADFVVPARADGACADRVRCRSGAARRVRVRLGSRGSWAIDGAGMPTYDFTDRPARDRRDAPTRCVRGRSAIRYPDRQRARLMAMARASGAIELYSQDRRDA